MKSSQEAIIPELSLWELPAFQGSIEEYSELQVRPSSSYTSRDPIRFNITTAPNEYVLLNQSELHVKIKLKPEWTTEPTSVDDWDAIHIADNLLHTMFKKMTLSLNNTEVTDDSSNYAFKAFFESTLRYGINAQNSTLSTVILNQASQERASRVRDFTTDDWKTASFWVGGMPHLDLAFQKKAIMGGTELMLELEPNKPAFYLHLSGSKTKKCEVEFLDICLYVHRVKVSKGLESAHREAMNLSPARYPYTRGELRTFLVAPGVKSCTLDNVYRGILPRRLFIAIIEESTFNGSFDTDTMIFVNANISRLAVFYDGQQHPNPAYEPVFRPGKEDRDEEYFVCESIREYRGFLKALGQNGTSATRGLNISHWESSPIFGFNFNPDLSDGEKGRVCPSKMGQLNIHASFKEPLAKPIVFLAFGEFDRLIEIDKWGQVYQM